MAGHVFVTRGDVRDLYCDARLVAGDFHERLPDKQRWLHPSEHPLLAGLHKDLVPPDAPFFMGCAQGGPDLWVTQTGTSRAPGASRDLAQSFRNTRAFLESAFAKLQGRSKTGRARPLLATHFVSSGVRNEWAQMGRIVDGLLDVCQEFVRPRDADVVVLAFGPAQHAALQHRRAQRHEAQPRLEQARDEALKQRLNALVDLAREGTLSLFVGAGVSQSAGLPNWKTLLAQVASRLPEDLARKALEPKDLLEQAGRLEGLFGKDGRPPLREVVAELTRSARPSLAHELLANLPVRQVVTLNYDELFEIAARGAGRAFQVIPHGRARDQAREWLLKLHGCRTRPEDIVLTREDYERYYSERGAFAGVVQALLVTQHMLLVGFGLADPNVQRTVEVVNRSLALDPSARAKVGTILTIDPLPAPVPAWLERFHLVSLFRHGANVPERARFLDLCLDSLAARSGEAHRYWLDPRFDALLTTEELSFRRRAKEFAGSLGSLAKVPAAQRLLAAMREMGLDRPARGEEVDSSPARAATSARRSARPKRGRSSGRSGERVPDLRWDQLNAHEQKVLAALGHEGPKPVMTIGELAALCFAGLLDKRRNSRVRSALRRLVRGELLEKTTAGSYRQTECGRAQARAMHRAAPVSE